MIIETLETRVRECEALARTTALPDKATWARMAERWRQLANYHTSTESRLQEKRRDRKYPSAAAISCDSPNRCYKEYPSNGAAGSAVTPEPHRWNSLA